MGPGLNERVTLGFAARHVSIVRYVTYYAMGIGETNIKTISDFKNSRINFKKKDSFLIKMSRDYMYQCVHLEITASCYQHRNTLTSDLSCADPEGSNSTLTFFDEGERGSKTTKSRPSAARQQNV